MYFLRNIYRMHVDYLRYAKKVLDLIFRLRLSLDALFSPTLPYYILPFFALLSKLTFT